MIKSSQHVNYFEFVITLWNFLTTSYQDMLKFIFKIFSIDMSLSNDVKVLQLIINIIHFNDNDLHLRLQYMTIFDTLMHNIDSNEVNIYNSVKKNVKDGNKLDQLVAMLVTPLWTLQNRLRCTILGESHWVRLSQIRESLPEEYNSDDCINYLKKSIIDTQCRERVFHKKLTRTISSEGTTGTTSTAS
jgi:hypothetical protein